MSPANSATKRASSRGRNNKRERMDKNNAGMDIDVNLSENSNIALMNPGLNNQTNNEISNVISNVVGKFDDVCSEAKRHIDNVQDLKARAELYLQFINSDVVKVMVNTMASYAEKSLMVSEVNTLLPSLSVEGQSLVVKSGTKKNTSSTYDVILRAKPGNNVDPVDIYRSVVTAHDIIANDWLPFNVRDLRIEMMNQNDALKLMDILNKSKYGNDSISKLFDISTVTKSNYAIKSIGIDSDEVKKVSWINQDKTINMSLAIKSLVSPTNKNWFRNGDVENVEIYKLGGLEKFVIKIMVSKDSFHRFLSHPCINRKVDLGLNRPVTFQEEVKHDSCWRCLDFGHSTTRCQGNLRCRFCGENHKALECKYKAAPVCFRCKQSNEVSKRQLPMTHDALSNACPAVKERRDVVRNLLREKFGGHHE